MKLDLKDNEILVLRNCKSDRTSYGGFVWPESGHVEAPDWRDDDNCGGGLHGLPWGEGGHYFINGEDSVLQWRYCDGNRCRIKTVYVGEDGIKPKTPYRYDPHADRVIEEPEADEDTLRED